MSEPKAKKTRKTAAPAEAKPRGGQTTYSEGIANLICERIADGEPLRQICRDESMPPWRTVYHWMASEPAFMARIAHAREAGHDAIAQECLEIADETAFDTIQGENGDRANSEWISRSKLRIETRLKLLAKWDPKRYGDKITQEHTGPEGAPLTINVCFD